VAGAGGVFEDLEGRALGGLIAAREVVAGCAETASAVRRLFGPQVRDPHALLGWARRNETVFARLCSRILAPACRVIGIAGAGGGIGKSSFARELATLLGRDDSRVVSLDDYLIPRLTRDTRGIGAHDPAANDLERAAADLERLRAGQPSSKPVYDHSRGGAFSTETIEPARYLIVEGVQALHPRVRPLIDLGVFLDASAAVRYRRVARDVAEKGLSETYARSVYARLEEECKKFLLPLRDLADVVIAVDDAFGLKWVSPA
jgi:uridine kinase